MIDKDAIQALQKADSILAAASSLLNAINPIQNQDKGTYGLAALPDDFKLHDLESKLDNRRRARGRMETRDIDSFAA
jgi:uncharacterized protein YfdQ (DUF2303 family)